MIDDIQLDPFFNDIIALTGLPSNYFVLDENDDVNETWITSVTEKIMATTDRELMNEELDYSANLRKAGFSESFLTNSQADDHVNMTYMELIYELLSFADYLVSK